MKEKKIKKLVNLKQASELSGKSCQQLRKMITSKKLKAVKQGRIWMIDPLDLDMSFLEKKEIDDGKFLNKFQNKINNFDINTEQKTFINFKIISTQQLSLILIMVVVLFSLSLFFSIFLSKGLLVKASFSKFSNQEKYISTEQEKFLRRSVFGD